MIDITAVKYRTYFVWKMNDYTYTKNAIIWKSSKQKIKEAKWDLYLRKEIWRSLIFTGYSFSASLPFLVHTRLFFLRWSPFILQLRLVLTVSVMHTTYVDQSLPLPDEAKCWLRKCAEQWQYPQGVDNFYAVKISSVAESWKRLARSI